MLRNVFFLISLTIYSLSLQISASLPLPQYLSDSDGEDLTLSNITPGESVISNIESPDQSANISQKTKPINIESIQAKLHFLFMLQLGRREGFPQIYKNNLKSELAHIKNSEYARTDMISNLFPMLNKNGQVIKDFDQCITLFINFFKNELQIDFIDFIVIKNLKNRAELKKSVNSASPHQRHKKRKSDHKKRKAKRNFSSDERTMRVIRKKPSYTESDEEGTNKKTVGESLAKARNKKIQQRSSSFDEWASRRLNRKS